MPDIARVNVSYDILFFFQRCRVIFKIRLLEEKSGCKKIVLSCCFSTSYKMYF